MAGPHSKRRKLEEGMKGKAPHRPKKFKKQTDYNSTSESEAEDTPDFQAVNLQDSSDEDEAVQITDLVTAMLSGSDEEGNDEPALADAEEITDGSNSDSDISSNESDGEEGEDGGNPNLIRKRKRNDPEAFATSMSKILSSKLSSSKRADPVLSRSQTAIQASKEMTDLALEKKAKRNMKEERRAALDKGRVKDVLGASTAFDLAKRMDAREESEVGKVGSVQEIMEEEKRLRKTAQRGVVKLFNAVRAAQVRGEQAAREARLKGVVGQGRREERVNEMSKKGFLELIAGGGGGLKAGGIEEA